jgi:hypothetical protein
MFTQAIEVAAQFTRAIHSISRNYGSTSIQPGTATLFFINSDGWALTCGHVANQLAAGEALARKANAFKNELSARRGTQKEKTLLKELEKKYGYSKSTPFELHNRFMNCLEGNLKVQVVKHKEVDVALIKFQDYTRLLCDTFPIFPSDTSGLQQGKFLCRLGFPFPEFTNFEYDADNDQIKWTDTGRKDTPRFPIEGMLTRHVGKDEVNIIGFELSTPGLRGQSGGPAFDIDGKVWGMQSETAHLDLNFDIDQKVMRKGKEKHVTDSPFLHTGRCVHVDILKSFMKNNNVQFTEA